MLLSLSPPVVAIKEFIGGKCKGFYAVWEINALGKLKFELPSDWIVPYIVEIMLPDPYICLDLWLGDLYGMFIMTPPPL